MTDYYESTPPSTPPAPARLGVRPLATTLWCLGGVLVAVAVAASAWLGVRVAGNRLPSGKERMAFVADMEITARGSQAAPLVLAVEQRELREYFFRESSIAGTGLEGIGDGRVSSTGEASTCGCLPPMAT